MPADCSPASFNKNTIARYKESPRENSSFNSFLRKLGATVENDNNNNEDLNETDLSGLDLSFVNLEGRDLSKSKFKNAILFNTKMTDVKLNKYKSLTTNQLACASFRTIRNTSNYRIFKKQKKVIFVRGLRAEFERLKMKNVFNAAETKRLVKLLKNKRLRNYMLYLNGLRAVASLSDEINDHQSACCLKVGTKL